MNGDCLHQRCSSLWSASSVSWLELEAPRLPRFLRLLHTESRQQKPCSCKAIHRSWILRVAPNPRYPPCSYGMVAMVTTHLKASGRTEVKLTIKAAFKATPTISSPLCMTWLTVSIRLNWKTIVYTPQQYHITKHPIMDHLRKGHTHVYLNTRTHTKLKLAQNSMCQISFPLTGTNQNKHCSWQPPPTTCQHEALLHQAVTSSSSKSSSYSYCSNSS